MKVKLIIILFGSMILFSDCNPFKNLGKTKEERRNERHSKRARRLVDKAVRIDPSILHPDTITIPGAHIDSSVHVDTVINFVDSIIDRIIHSLDDRGGDSTGFSGLDREDLREWAIRALKDSIRMRDLIRDTITHRFLRNDVVYRMKIWDHNGKIYYDLDQGDKVIIDADVIIKELNWWERNSWLVKPMGILILILLILWVFREFVKKILKKIFP